MEAEKLFLALFIIAIFVIVEWVYRHNGRVERRDRPLPRRSDRRSSTRGRGRKIHY
jgi:hypothetical protein